MIEYRSVSGLRMSRLVARFELSAFASVSRQARCTSTLQMGAHSSSVVVANLERTAQFLPPRCIQRHTHETKKFQTRICLSEVHFVRRILVRH